MSMITTFWNRLGLRIIFLFLLLTTLPLGLVETLAYRNGRQIIEANVFNHLVSTNLLKISEFQRWIRDNEFDLEFLAQRPLVRRSAALLDGCQEMDGECRAAASQLLGDHLQPAVEGNVNLSTISLIRRRDGLILVSTEADLLGKYRENETYFLEGINDTYTGDVLYTPSHGEAAMHIATPVFSPDGETVAVLVAHANLAEMSAIIAIHSTLSASEDTYLVNDFNFFVTEPRFGEGFALMENIHTEGVKDCLDGNTAVDLYDDYRSIPVIGAYHWLPGHDLCILTEVDQAEAFAPIQAFGNRLIAIGVGVALAAAGIGIYFARGINSPLQQLIAGVQEISRGNLNHAVTIPGQTEFSQLAETFNQMTANLRHSLGETAQSRRTVLALSEAAQAVQRARTPDAVYCTIGEEVHKLGYHVVIFTRTEDGGHLRIPHLTFETELLRAAEKLAGVSARNYRIPIQSGDIYDRVLRDRRAIYLSQILEPLAQTLPGVTRPFARQILKVLKLEDAIYAPLVVSGDSWGILLVLGKGLTEADLAAVSAFGNQAAIALENALLYQETRQRADALQESEARFQSLLSSLRDVVWSASVDGSKFLYINEAAEQVYGRPLKDFFENPRIWEEVVFPEDRERVWRESQDLLKEGFSESEYRILRPDGEVRWLKDRKTVIYDREGKAVRIGGIASDITARVKTEEALRTSSNRLALAIEASGMGIYEHRVPPDAQSYHSEQWAAILGYQLGELPLPEGRFNWALEQIHPEDRASYEKAYQDLIDGKSLNCNIQLRMRHKSGRFCVIDNIARAIARDDEDRVTSLLGVIQDITERVAAEKELVQHRDHLEELVAERTHALKEAQNATLNMMDDLEREMEERQKAQQALAKKAIELERSNQELEQFAYVASHDLQEPLRMVTSYLQLLERRFGGSLDGDAREFIDFAVDGAGRMKTLINDLLSYSRVGTRGKPFMITDLNTVFDRVCLNLSTTIRETNARVTSDELPTLQVDEGQISQLFQNLVSNAIKFHKPGEPPEVYISAALTPTPPHPLDGVSGGGGERTSPPPDRGISGTGIETAEPNQPNPGGTEKVWCFSVQDNGIGIEEAYFERIFVIFQRLHTKGEYPGTGIGLAISKRIVERHGGKIWVKSQPGIGTTFCFTLPEKAASKNNDHES